MTDDWVVPVLDKDHCVALWDRVLLHVWHFDTTASAVQQLTHIARAFSARSRAPVSSVSVVERTSPPPKDEVRGLLAKFYRDLAPHMVHQIVIADGGGFRAALVRAVGVTLSALAPRALPFKFMGSVREAAASVAPSLSPSAGGADELARVVERVREDSRKVASRT